MYENHICRLQDPYNFGSSVQNFCLLSTKGVGRPICLMKFSLVGVGLFQYSCASGLHGPSFLVISCIVRAVIYKAFVEID